MRCSTARLRRYIPLPDDPLADLPEPTPEQFMDMGQPEDEALLANGEFDGDDGDEDEAGERFIDED